MNKINFELPENALAKEQAQAIGRAIKNMTRIINNSNVNKKEDKIE